MEKIRETVFLTRKEKAEGNECLRLHDDGNLVWLSSPALDSHKWILHGFSTRLGGVSTGETGTMNLSYPREENRDNVTENYRRIAAAIGFDPAKIVMSAQTHTVNIRQVEEDDIGSGFTKERSYANIDGLITNIPGAVLTVFSSDCVPLLIADPVHKAVGAAHSGWRGTVGDMAGYMLQEMKRAYGTSPEDVTAVLGPSICGNCYEIGPEVAEEFRSAYPSQWWPSLLREKENGKYLLDLWQACALNFARAGVLPQNIHKTDICTYCNPALLFSHRRQFGKQGNLGAFIAVREI